MSRIFRTQALAAELASWVQAMWWTRYRARRCGKAVAAAGMRQVNPGQWGDLDGTALANLVRPYGLGPKQLGGDGNPRGYRLDDLQAAIGRATAAR